jgi:transposase InsO family protein
MSERWLNIDELIELTEWSARTVRRKAESGQIKWRNARGRQKNGKPIREYSLLSLPGDLQIKAAQEVGSFSKYRSAQSTDAGQSSSQLTLFMNAPSSIAVMPRVALPDPDDHKQATDRLLHLEPLLNLTTKECFPATMPDGATAPNWSAAVEWVADGSEQSTKTIRRWISRYRQGGLPALADRPRSDKGSSHFFARYHAAAILAAYLHLECRQSVRAVYSALCSERELVGVPEQQLPAYETVRAWFLLVPPYLKTYALEGKRAYRERMAPYVQRCYDDVASNACWVSDHMIHDVEVMNDCFPEAPWGAPIRLRFTCLLDFHSRYVVGTSWCWEGSSRSIATAMRRAVTQHGPCEHFYCDNGKDYKRVAKGAMPAYLVESPLAAEKWFEAELDGLKEIGILGRLGISVSHCIVRHPQSKHVERFFRTLHEQFDKLFYQHYTGGAPHLRPDATSAEMGIHRKLAKHDRVDESNHPRASTFIAKCQAWIEKYHHQEHSGKGMDGRCPADVFVQDAPPLGQRRPKPEPFELALMLAERKRIGVRESSVTITITPGHPRRFVHHDEVSRDILHDLTGTHVLVAYDPNDQSAVAILDERGIFLCIARAEEMLRFAPGDAETQSKISASMADRRHLEKETRGRLTSISRAARSLGVRTPVEMLDTPMELPMAVNDSLTHGIAKFNRGSLTAVAPPTAEETAVELSNMLLEARK